MVSCDGDFVAVREGGEVVYLGLEFGWSSGVGEVAGVDEDVAWRDEGGYKGVSVGDADDGYVEVGFVGGVEEGEEVGGESGDEFGWVVELSADAWDLVWIWHGCAHRRDDLDWIFC